MSKVIDFKKFDKKDGSIYQDDMYDLPINLLDIMIEDKQIDRPFLNFLFAIMNCANFHTSGKITSNDILETVQDFLNIVENEKELKNG